MSIKAKHRLHRWLAFLCLWTGLLTPLSSQALGVGEASVLSSLGQSLKTDIPVLTHRQSSLEQLTVRVASHQDHERAGLAQPSYLRSLSAEFKKNNDGTSYIRVTTDQVIDEPILEFLLEISWADGRMLKQYTLFIDPPLFNQMLSAPVKLAINEAAKQSSYTSEYQASPTATSVTRPLKTAPPKPAAEMAPEFSVDDAARLMASQPKPTTAHSKIKATPREKTVQVNAVNNTALLKTLKRTRSGDSLWNIARAARNDRSVTTQQVMLAILETNPQAFLKHNVNTLKANVDLVTPTEKLVNTLTAKEAVAEIQQQNWQWKNDLAERKQKKQRIKKATSAQVVETKISGPRLRLVAPESMDKENTESSVAAKVSSDATPSSIGSKTTKGDKAALISGSHDAVGDISVPESKKTVDDTEKVLKVPVKEILPVVHEATVENDSFLDRLVAIFMNNLWYWLAAFTTIALGVVLIIKRAVMRKDNRLEQEGSDILAMSQKASVNEESSHAQENTDRRSDEIKLNVASSVVGAEAMGEKEQNNDDLLGDNVLPGFEDVTEELTSETEADSSFPEEVSFDPAPVIEEKIVLNEIIENDLNEAEDEHVIDFYTEEKPKEKQGDTVDFIDTEDNEQKIESQNEDTFDFLDLEEALDIDNNEEDDEKKPVLELVSDSTPLSTPSDTEDPVDFASNDGDLFDFSDMFDDEPSNDVPSQEQPEEALDVAKVLIEMGDTAKARKQLNALLNDKAASKVHAQAQELLNKL